MPEDTYYSPQVANHWQQAAEMAMSGDSSLLDALIESYAGMRDPDLAELRRVEAIWPYLPPHVHNAVGERVAAILDDDGSDAIYGTYTAYNGISGFPSLFRSNDLRTITSQTMSGKFVKNKGMALFPRRVRGKYIMSGRLDGVNRYILESDDVLVWNQARRSETPKYWWELSLIGNCGSPVETPEGWLMLTHGVGPMREYAIAATLLDLDDPTKVIARSAEPIIVPGEDERAGYVPNVVYTCGSMLHNGSLIIPYAIGDVTTTFAWIDADELIASLARE